MNSGYGDVRYRVYIWGFSCLDYSFDILTSRLVIWPYITGFTTFTLPTVSLLSPLCLWSWNDFQCMLLTRIYLYTSAFLCTPRGIHHTNHWRVLTSLDLYVQIPKLGACGFFRLIIRDAQRKREFSAHRLKPYPSKPLLISRVFFLLLVSIFCTVHTCISLCILEFFPVGDVIFL